MALKSSSEVPSQSHNAKEKSKIYQQPETSKVTQETKKKNQSEKRKYSRRKTELFMRRKVTVSSEKTNPSDNFCNHLIIPQVAPMAVPMSMYYPQYPLNYSFPITISDWNPIIPVQIPLYSPHPIPVIINPTIIATQTIPYVAPATQPVLPIVPPIITNENIISNFKPLNLNEIQSSQQPMNSISNCTGTYTKETNFYSGTKNVDKNSDLVEFYITLPKELFPAARMLKIDPNPIIDEFCKIPNVQKHAPWLLDLEFGVPKSPISRPIAIYNVKLNSVNCKNTPETIHPGFESCSQEFKNVLLFYYHCIVSAWYRGYTIMYLDNSVENFQSWVLLPMQLFGMCWP